MKQAVKNRFKQDAFEGRLCRGGNELLSALGKSLTRRNCIKRKRKGVEEQKQKHRGPTAGKASLKKRRDFRDASYRGDETEDPLKMDAKRNWKGSSIGLGKSRERKPGKDFKGGQSITHRKARKDVIMGTGRCSVGQRGAWNGRTRLTESSFEWGKKRGYEGVRRRAGQKAVRDEHFEKSEKLGRNLVIRTSPDQITNTRGGSTKKKGNAWESGKAGG